MGVCGSMIKPMLDLILILSAMLCISIGLVSIYIGGVTELALLYMILGITMANFSKLDDIIESWQKTEERGD